MPVAEPTITALRNPVLRYFLATRPPFLAVTLYGCLIGLATAFVDGVNIRPATAIGTVVFALVAHAAINVLNDYYDALNGTDANNLERIFPFTGGSRFIQNGVLTPRETAAFGFGLMAVVIAAGMWLTVISSPDLIWIGGAGLAIGYAYSAPPFKLNSRGLGEACVWAGFSLLAIGADFVQRGSLSSQPLIAVAAYALLVTNILYINQFPDRKADAAAGKWHWVVRLGASRACWGYGLLGLLAYGWLTIAVIAGKLPWLALIALLPVFLSLRAAQDLFKYADDPAKLAGAIKLTIAAASLHGLLIAVSLVGARWFGQ